MRHSEVVPSIPGTYRSVGIALAVLGCGLVVHGFVRLYSIHIAATAAAFNLEVSSGALLMVVGAIFLARKGGGAPIPASEIRSRKKVLLALAIAIMVICGMVLLANLR
jgi:hypothetical protein